MAIVLAACGRTPGPEVSPRDPSQAGEIAPECHEAERLRAALPEGVEPTGTTAEPIEDGSVPGSASEGDDALPDALSLGPEIEQWAQREAPDSFAGVWLDQELGGFAVAFADEVDRYAAEVRERIHPGLAVAEADHSYAELRDIQDRVTEEQMGQPDHEPGAVRSTGVDVLANRTSLGVFDPDADRLSELSEIYGATAICFEIEAAPGPPVEAIDTLAKAQGWRDGLTEEVETMFAVFEVAYDRETAEVAWRDNVADDLEPRDDDLPAEPGLYGTLDEVDFDRQAVVVWSSGESGSCPEWLTNIDGAGGTIRVQREATAEMCTDDFNPYRLVLAVDRDRLPAPEELAAAQLEGVPDGTVRSYPIGDG
ncbi:hypothetical protein [Nitriliruptor alkaliphilus]|uniref:hypothetical protein n=1 Tax=Nitriliruptor alkaliphilus TaxID=427918 RepID=UPI0006973FBC|nr:hypothetical protein [Nitriliruptor alkaliphilus]